MGQCWVYHHRLIHGKGSCTDNQANNTLLDTQQQNSSSESNEMAAIRDLKLPKDLVDHVLGTLFGNCIGDAIGLITEFLIKPQVTDIFGSHKHFEYKSKEISANKFLHQGRFDTGDWTDDGDQMVLILLSLIDNSGKVLPTDFGKKLKEWRLHGFQELGDTAGMGIGRTTLQALIYENFDTDPHQASYNVWIRSDCKAAPNGGVMRTSILGVHNHHDIDMVIRNTIAMCRVTHADPRCVASCIAVTTCIAMILQGKHRSSGGCQDTQALTNDAYEYAKPYLNIYHDQVHPDPKKSIPEFPAEDLHFYMNVTNIDDLKLDEKNKIGYTYKCLGAGFWALRQKDFRDAIETITREAGDADTNCAVAGALLGCKLGYKRLPKSWREGLIHKKWLQGHIYKYLAMDIMTDDGGTPVDATTTEATRLLERDTGELSVQEKTSKAEAADTSDNQDASSVEGACGGALGAEAGEESDMNKSEKDEVNELRK